MRRRFIDELKTGLGLIFGLAGYLAITIAPPIIGGELIFDTTPDWWAIAGMAWILLWIAIGSAFAITAMDHMNEPDPEEER